MKRKLFSILMIMNSLVFFINAQTGINTSNVTPTKTLDINGELRIRTIPTVMVGNVLVADVNGNISKVSNYLVDNATNFGDIKKGFQSGDHQGWYLLNGRNISALPVNAQTNAISLGFTTNIPDARGKFLKISANPTSIAIAGGSNGSILTQANLPSSNFTGITTVGLAHSHNATDNYSIIQSVTSEPFVTFTLDDSGPKTRPDFYEDKTTTTSGAHSHSGTVTSNGSGSAFDNTPQYFVVNIFMYLGQ